MSQGGHEPSILQMPDSRAGDPLPRCAPLRGVTNLSAEAIRIEGWFQEVGVWAPLLPHCAPRSDADAFYGGALWLPRAVILRSVRHNDGEPLTVFGPLGNGSRLVQPTHAA